MSLCFLQAHVRWFSENGAAKITRDEYLESSLAHFRGVRHAPDNEPEHPHSIGVAPWVSSFMDVALKGDYEPLKDTSEWKTLLDSCIDGDNDRFKKTLAKIDPSKPPNPMQPAACLAAQNERHEILRHCLQAGAKMDASLDRSCRNGANTFGMMKVLHEADWQGIRSSPAQAESWMGWWGHDSLQAAWLRCHALPGGSQADLNHHKGAHRRPTAEQIDEWFGDINW